MHQVSLVFGQSAGSEEGPFRVISISGIVIMAWGTYFMFAYLEPLRECERSTHGRPNGKCYRSNEIYLHTPMYLQHWSLGLKRLQSQVAQNNSWYSAWPCCRVVEGCWYLKTFEWHTTLFPNHQGLNRSDYCL